MKIPFPTFEGNRKLSARLSEDILADRLSHAYLIEGAAGAGKKTLAYLIAAALACEKRDADGVPLPCGECPACRKILSGNSPDVIRVNRADKATLGVDPIRAMHNDVHIAPNELENKVYLIEDAHLMTPQAQNAFLLTLEEPPPYVRFFLLTESVTALLETVRSRAPTLRLEPIPDDRVAAFLTKSSPAAQQLTRESPADFRELIAAAHGSIGRALTLLDPKEKKAILDSRAAVRKFCSFCASRHRSAEVLTFLTSLGQKREELILFLNTLSLCLRDLFLCKQTEQTPLCFFPDREEAAGLSYRFSAPQLLSLCDLCAEAEDRLRMNANVRLTLTRFFARAGLLDAG